MKRRLIELAKSILILLLVFVVAALTLLVTTQGQLQDIPLISSLGTALGLTGAEPAYAEPETATYEAARPDTVVVTTQEGHSTVAHSFDAVDAVFDVLGRYLSEALETAGTPVQVTSARWQAALTGEGVYFHYWGQVPLAALADWYRTELGCEELHTVQSGAIVLSIGEDGLVSLYYLSDGAYWRCETALEAAGMLEQMSAYRPDGSVFAFESSVDAVQQLDGLTVLNLTSAPVVQDATASNPVETDVNFIKNTATILGFNPFAETSYTASDGSREFNDSEYFLSISTDGVIRLTALTASSDRFQAASTETAALIEQARSLLASLTEGNLGDAQLYLTAFTQEDGVTTVTFRYFLSSIPVEQQDGAAAVAVFTDSRLTSLTLRARTYTLSTTSSTLMPAVQAAALAPAGSYLTVEYADNGGETLTCGWAAE